MKRQEVLQATQERPANGARFSSSVQDKRYGYTQKRGRSTKNSSGPPQPPVEVYTELPLSDLDASGGKINGLLQSPHGSRGPPRSLSDRIPMCGRRYNPIRCADG